MGRGKEGEGGGKRREGREDGMGRWNNVCISSVQFHWTKAFKKVLWNWFRIAPEATPTFKLPGLRSEPHRRAISLAPHIGRSTAPPSSPTQAWTPHVPSSRIPFPKKRHMIQGEGPGTHPLSSEQLCSTILKPTQPPGGLNSTLSLGGLNSTIPLGGPQFLKWFSNLTEGE